jgi:hypothetical protein
MNINLVRLKLLFGDDAIVSKRPDAGEVPSSLVQRGPRTLFFGTRAAKRGPGALDAGLRLGAGSRIEQRRRFRAHARNHLAAFHAVAGVQLDSKHAAGYGSGHDEPIAHARHPFFVNGHDQRAGRDGGDIDLDRRRPHDDREQAGDDRRRTKNATIREQAEHRHHSRVLSTATRSRRSSRRLTRRPDTPAAAMTIRNDQAIVAGDVTKDSRYTSLLKAVMMTWPNTYPMRAPIGSARSVSGLLLGPVFISVAAALLTAPSISHE